MTRIALLAALVPLVSFAQQQPAANDDVEKPAETATPVPEPKVETPPATAQQATPPPEEKKDDHASCEHGHGKWGGGWSHHGKHDGVEQRWGGWRNMRPWRAAIEGGSAFGLGLTAQLTYRPWPGFAVGVGAIGFGQNAIETFDNDRNGEIDADVRQGYYLSLARYRSWGGRGGFFAGAKFGAAETRLTSDDGSEDRMWAGFITPEVGFQWFPFQSVMFIRPALGASLVVARWGGTANAPVPPFIVPSATLTLGFAL